jgi:predicted DCC family thiol-disulfide oxidoreductase YuxK
MKLTALNNGWTSNQYKIFRILFGSYLAVHFLYLLPWVSEVFSSQGMLSDAALSPLIHFFPNMLSMIDSPNFLIFFVGTAAIAAICFTLGYKEKYAAIFMWYVLACLFTRNPLIANPSLPYVGWMLLASCFVTSKSCTISDKETLQDNWFVMPKGIFVAAWAVLAISYSYSGYTKLLSPSWVDGNNIHYVLQNPLARDYFLRDFFLWLPPIFLQLLTWTVLYIELLFAPLVLIPKMRPIMWSAMLFIQCGFALLLNFPDLTFAMILFHLFTFNPAWIKSSTLSNNAILYYDGNCALCHGTVQFILAEDKIGQLRFSPLQSQFFKSRMSNASEQSPLDTIILIDGNKIMKKSDAVIALLTYLGGLWRVLSWALMLMPRPIRNMGYDIVGYYRYQLVGKTDEMCPIIPKSLKARFEFN